ncbi:hypothetical protein [Parapedobacter sp. 2B3]|uniref:hypothetical protein n=1 Tax=Parapedobacter sp. 2B3 TaxID=3342381 RepID=UPI0035B5A2D2
MNKLNFFDEVSKMGASATERSILRSVLAKGGAQGQCDLCDDELAEAIGVKSAQVEIAIPSLIDRGLMVMVADDGVRRLELSDYSKERINKINIINNIIIEKININKTISNSPLINKHHPLTEKDCKKLAKQYSVDFSAFDYLDFPSIIITHIQLRVNIFKKIKTRRQLGLFVRWIHKHPDIRPSIPFGLLEENEPQHTLENMFRFICGFAPKQFKEEADEEEVRRQQQEKKRQRLEQKTFESSIVDVTSAPEYVKKDAQGNKVVSLIGTIKHVYWGGSPKMCNLVIAVDGYDYDVPMTISYKHNKNLMSSDEHYAGRRIRVCGRLAFSKYHMDRFSIRNKIESINRVTPIEFLESDEDTFELNTRLKRD